MKIIALATLSLISMTSFAFEWKDGVHVNDNNLLNLAKNSMEYAVSDYVIPESDGGSVLGYYLNTDASELFSVSDNLILYKSNYSLKVLENSWPLTRWPYESIEPEIPFRLTDHQLGEMGFGVNAYHSSLGCLDDSPLRYGDIEGDGAAELILFLGDDLVMFSPSYEKTVFMIRYSIADWLSTTETATFNLRPLKNADATAQYQSAMVASSLHPYRLPGYRGYAKIFIGNFDGDVHPDILVWRKLYESHLINNPVQGFTKLKDTFVHYEQNLTAQATLKTGVTSEYLPQKTDSATIKNWLKTSKLTWQKGFPSTSECAGQKGQLIPEMHDVLLNDPDVLQ